jgi:hypothetical protein
MRYDVKAPKAFSSQIFFILFPKSREQLAPLTLNEQFSLYVIFCERRSKNNEKPIENEFETDALSYAP